MIKMFAICYFQNFMLFFFFPVPERHVSYWKNTGLCLSRRISNFNCSINSSLLPWFSPSGNTKHNEIWIFHNIFFLDIGIHFCEWMCTSGLVSMCTHLYLKNNRNKICNSHLLINELAKFNSNLCPQTTGEKKKTSIRNASTMVS